MLCLLRTDPRPHITCHRKTLSSTVFHLHCVPPLSGWHSIHRRCRQPHSLHRWLPQVHLVGYFAFVQEFALKLIVCYFQEICTTLLCLSRSHYAWAGSGGNCSCCRARSELSRSMLQMRSIFKTLTFPCIVQTHYSCLTGLWIGAVVRGRRARLLPAGRTSLV